MSRFYDHTDTNRYPISPYKTTINSSYHLPNQPNFNLQRTIDKNNTQIEILNKIKNNQEVQLLKLTPRPSALYQSRKKSRSTFQPSSQYLLETDCKSPILNKEPIIGNSSQEQNYLSDAKKDYYLKVSAGAPRQKSNSREIKLYQTMYQKDKKESRGLKMDSFKLQIPLNYQQKEKQFNPSPRCYKQQVSPTIIKKNRASQNTNLTPTKRQKTPPVNFSGLRHQRGQQKTNLTPAKREKSNLTGMKREKLNLTPAKYQKTPLVNFSSTWREKGQQSTRLISTQCQKTPLPRRSIDHHNQKIQEKSLKLSDFSMRKPLGQGKFGQVFQAIHKDTNSLFALKRVKKETIKTYMMETQFMMEIKMQFFFNHNNILRLYAVFDDSTYIYLVLEYMEEGTLYGKLKKLGQLPEKLASHISTDILQGVAYLHQNNVAHRDIKPQNIVITCGVYKLCDFGWSAICQDDDRRNTFCGTLDYSAPEILQGKQYGKAIDLWCLGVLTYELLVGKAPFYNISRKQTMRKIVNAQNQELVLPNTLSLIARSFIKSLIKWDPQQRMEAREALSHAFIKDYAGDD